MANCVWLTSEGCNCFFKPSYDQTEEVKPCNATYPTDNILLESHRERGSSSCPLVRLINLELYWSHPLKADEYPCSISQTGSWRCHSIDDAMRTNGVCLSAGEHTIWNAVYHGSYNDSESKYLLLQSLIFQISNVIAPRPKGAQAVYVTSRCWSY